VPIVKVYDDNGKLVREGQPRFDEEKRGFIVRYELMGIIAIMLLQTMGGIWWAATQTANMANVKAELIVIKTQLLNYTNNVYKAADAERAHIAIDRRLDKSEARIVELERYHITGGK
jgi:hypothetical protein